MDTSRHQRAASPRAPHIVIVGAGGFTNLGDDAILAAMLDELQVAIPDARFTVTTGDPARLTGTAAVSMIPFADQAIDLAISDADLVIIGGGGFIYDHEARVTTYDFLQGNRSLFYPYYRAAFTAHARGIPVYFYAVGIGPLATPTGRALTRTILSLASAITVRDPLSLVELHATGLTWPIPELTADPAVRLSPAPAPWPGLPDGRLVGFVVRKWLQRDGRWTPSGAEHFDSYLTWLAGAADHVVERWDATPVFLPLQRRYDDDRSAEAQVIARMRHRGRARLFDDVNDVQSLQSVIGGLDVLVSTRLHPLILAAVATVPGVGIALAPKVGAFLAGLDLGDLSVSPWRRSTDLTDRIDRVLAEPDQIRERQRTGVACQREVAARNPAIAAALLEQNAPEPAEN